MVDSIKTMEGLEVKGGQKVLLIWFGTETSESMKDIVTNLRQKVGDSGKVQLEHADKFTECK